MKKIKSSLTLISLYLVLVAASLLLSGCLGVAYMEAAANHKIAETFWTDRINGVGLDAYEITVTTYKDGQQRNVLVIKNQKQILPILRFFIGHTYGWVENEGQLWLFSGRQPVPDHIDIVIKSSTVAPFRHNFSFSLNEKKMEAQSLAYKRVHLDLPELECNELMTLLFP